MPEIIIGRAAPLAPANIDTDVIMPKRFLRTITREGLADGVLADLQFDIEGRPNPDFILNRQEFSGAEILVVGDNFGCGSSREHAVWGLKQLGIKAIIGTSFAGIFYDNARKNILALACIAPEQRDAMLRDLGDGPKMVTVNIARKAVTWGEHTAAMDMDSATQASLIAEQDDVTASLQLAEQIRTFESMRPSTLRVKVPQ